MFAIEIDRLNKQFKNTGHPTLQDFSFTAEEGSITGLLGPNGAGKTTSINIMCGLLRADSGSVSILGKDVAKHLNEIKYAIGVAPQQIALFADLTARENFKYIGTLYGIDPQVLKKTSEYLLERLGLEKHADKRIGKYSGGMKRRANIIASILHQPKLLILDEPTAGVDVHSRSMILDFLMEYHQEDNTILYTSHLLEEAQKICDTITIIDEGKAIISGTPQSLIDTTFGCKNLEEVFLHYTGKSIRD